MMKSFSQVVALIPCPDSDARNIWPEFWTDNTRPFAISLNDAQLLYIHKYLKQNRILEFRVKVGTSTSVLG